MNESIRSSFVHQIEWCDKLGSPLYAEILTIALHDLDDGGPVSLVVSDFEGDAVPDALALRFMGGLHRLVLSGAAPLLARHFPTVGGTPDAPDLGEDVLVTVAANVPTLREALEIAPQTNEIGRSAALFAGLLAVLGDENRPVRLLEIGSSAGLNLMLDTFTYETADWSWQGVDGAPILRPDWQGGGPDVPDSIRIVSRRGCDLAPIDVSYPNSRDRLLSFVWADQLDRFERLKAAIDLVGPDSFRLDTADAGAWLAEVLEEPVEAGVLTVVQHSVMWQYLPEATRSLVNGTFERFGERASDSRPLAHIAFEGRPEAKGNGGMALTVRHWPGGGERILGFGHPHVSSFTWL